MITRAGRIAQLDRTSGAKLATYRLTAMADDFESKYGFAYWGGRHYVCIRQYGQDNSEVWRFDLSPEGGGSDST